MEDRCPAYQPRSQFEGRKMIETKSPPPSFILAAVLLAVFVVPGSISGTAVALPFISADLQADSTRLQWVVNAFNLTFACFTLIWGTLSDSLGRKRAFITGACLYALASAGSLFSPDVLWLDLFRAMAGIGGAAIFACGSAILISVFEGHQRTRAFALFGMTAGLGITLGPTISGALLEWSGWQAIFGLHAGVLCIVLILSVYIPADLPANQRTGRLDVTGAALFIGTMLLMMLTISQGTDWGWLSLETLMSTAMAVLLLAAFVFRVSRSAQPVLNLALLRNRRFSGLILVPVAASFTFVTLLTYFPTYLTGAMQMPPSKAGFTMLFLTSPVLIFPLIAGRLAARGISPDRLMCLSLGSLLTGTALLLVSVEPLNSFGMIAVSLLMIGMGMGMSAGLVDGEALGCVGPHETGMAAGLLNTFRLGSEAVAVALYGSLLSASLTQLGSGSLEQAGQSQLLNPAISSSQEAFVHTNVVLLTVAFLVSVVSVFLIRGRVKVVQVSA